MSTYREITPDGFGKEMNKIDPMLFQLRISVWTQRQKYSRYLIYFPSKSAMGITMHRTSIRRPVVVSGLDRLISDGPIWNGGGPVATGSFQIGFAPRLAVHITSWILMELRMLAYMYELITRATLFRNLSHSFLNRKSERIKSKPPISVSEHVTAVGGQMPKWGSLRP